MPAPGSRFSFEGAPPRNLPFPEQANITAVELLTFLPNCITSVDVVSRFASNQARKNPINAIAAIVNSNRDLDKEWIADYCSRVLRNVMRRAGWENWTLLTHRNFVDSEAESWDATNLSTKGFKTACETTGGAGLLDDDIPFATLMDGVRDMPVGNDALDLTRMAQHCSDHPEEEWLYPSQYDELLKQLGGPQQPTAANEDRAAFHSWMNVTPPSPRPKAERPALPVRQTRSTRRQPSVSKPDKTTKQKSTTSTPKMRRHARKSTTVEELSEGSQQDESSDNEAEVREYHRDPTRWVKPTDTSDVFSGEALQHAFLEQASFHTDNLFDAYAFRDGPRQEAPFRPLHRIMAPKFHDVSIWAENLRWATEQYLTFGEMGWTECPEHMDRITAIRVEQIRASSELVLKIGDAQGEAASDLSKGNGAEDDDDNEAGVGLLDNWMQPGWAQAYGDSWTS